MLKAGNCLPNAHIMKHSMFVSVMPHYQVFNVHCYFTTSNNLIPSFLLGLSLPSSLSSHHFSMIKKDPEQLTTRDSVDNTSILPSTNQDQAPKATAPPSVIAPATLSIKACFFGLTF
jgi:hypothetical protein